MYLLKFQCVLKIASDWWEDELKEKEELTFAMTTNGEQFVPTAGEYWMQGWFAGNWDTLEVVRHR